MHIANFIDIETWNKAGWHGTLFAVSPDINDLPAVGFLFHDESAGRKIFNDWINRIGREDEFELIRLSIIEGNIPGQDPGYSVYIGTDSKNYVSYVKEQEIDLSKSLLGMVGRFLRMHPQPNSPFLPRFKASYQKSLSCNIIPVFGVATNLIPDFDLSLRKKQIQFLQANALGKNDLEHAVLNA